MDKVISSKKIILYSYCFKQEYQKAWAIIDGRLKLQDFLIPGEWLDNFRDKIWTGGVLNKSEKVLIVKEQGVGDEILYSSMFSEVLKYFNNCKIEADERLLKIFKRSFNTKNIFKNTTISKDKEALKEIDKVIFAFDLPKLFRNSINDFNKKPGYLKPDITMKKNIELELKAITNKKKIGITWKSKREIIGKDKSIDLSFFEELIKEKDKFTFFNLQYGDVEKEINNLDKKNLKVLTLNNLDLFNDFDKISALLVNLDLFITISNTTAHLAGALNVPTWLIKPKTNAIFHYWNQPNNTTPWYPSIKLIEQDNDHNELMQKIKKDLNKHFN